MLALVVFMAWVALIYTGPVPTVPQFGEWNDKALHVGAFGLLAALVVLPAPAPRALLALALSAAVLELAQLSFPLRQASVADLVASMAGVGVGWLVGAAGRLVVALVTRRQRGPGDRWSRSISDHN